MEVNSIIQLETQVAKFSILIPYLYLRDEKSIIVSHINT